MSTISSNIVGALGGGSGIDIKALAENLAGAEMQPRIDGINKKISETEAQISAYGYIKVSLTQLENAFKQLDDASDFASVTPSVSQPNALGISTSTTAATGSFDLTVNQIATAQLTKTNEFAASGAQINGGAGFTMELSVHGGESQTITVRTDTPEGIVNAINRADLGITARLIKTSDGSNPFTIVVTGETGSTNDFTITSSADGVNFDTQLQTAADANLTYQGMTITRANNEISDLIHGVTLNLYSPTNGIASINLGRDTQTVKDKFNNLVTIFNDLEFTLKELANTSSKFQDESGNQVGGSLAVNSILQTIRSMARGLITSDSSTPSGGMRAARDVGLSFDRNGQLTLDEAKLNTALQNNFDDVVKIFSAGSDGKSIYSRAPSGIAGDAVVKINASLRLTGLISTSSTNASEKVKKYQDQLTSLNDRLSQIQQRYLEQFATMDALVGNIRKTQEGLTSTFAGMMATYTNKG